MGFAGKALIVAGLVLVLLGAGLLLASRHPGSFGWTGNLPGDIPIKRDSFSFYFPLATCVLVSVVASLLWWLVSRFF